MMANIETIREGKKKIKEQDKSGARNCQEKQIRCKAGGQVDRRGSWEILDQDSSDQRRATWEASCRSPPAASHKEPKDYKVLHVSLCLSAASQM